MAVLQLYEEGGFEIDEDFRELPDHVAVGARVPLPADVHAEPGAGTWVTPMPCRVRSGLQSRFLDQHLGAWIGPFTAAVKAGAQTAFYRELAELTERFVRLMERDAKADH